MNSTVYLFGDFGQGITSYPIDYTQSLFDKFVSESNAPTQLIMYRDGEIMNYGYARRIENDHFFGLCVQINGQYLSTVKRLFDIFEDVIANIAVRGELIRINEQGNLVETISLLSNNPKEVERATDYCRNELNKIEGMCKKLPTIDYSTSNSDRNYFKEDDNALKIITASLKNGCTFVYKKTDYDTLALAGYRSTLFKLNEKYTQATNHIKDLDSEMATLRRQKKQIGVVASLVLLLFIGSIVFFNVMESKDQHIEEQAATIVKQDSENKNLTQEKQKLTDDNMSLGDRNAELIRMYNAKVDSCTMLENMCIDLASENTKLRSRLNIEKAQYENSMSTLRSINRQIEQRADELKKQLDLQYEAKNKLTKDYNNLMWQYNALQNKYYQTKEGKRELKRK